MRLFAYVGSLFGIKLGIEDQFTLDPRYGFQNGGIIKLVVQVTEDGRQVSLLEPLAIHRTSDLPMFLCVLSLRDSRGDFLLLIRAAGAA